MNWTLGTAAVLLAGVGLAHSVLGEHFIIARLLRRADLPRLFGSDEFTRSTIRFAWHLPTVAWWGIAAVLLFLAGTFPGISVARGVLLSIASTFGASALLALLVTKGRHLSWVIFLAVALLCLMASA